ncbi:MAG TPA: hypothetical protein VGR62_13155 [Candidatus Binatia bacterium]|jgi:hypothetical protein|nr:hypothetical protein [Candidatus Binatia bacterium]
MRTYAKISTSGLLALILAAVLVPTTARALHEESPPAHRLTSADDHAHPFGRSWANWFAFESTQDLANVGAARAPGSQIFVFNMGFFDCAQGTTKTCNANDAPDDCQQTPCPPAGTQYIRQVTNGPGQPGNPSVGNPPFSSDQTLRLFNNWVAFDALGSFNGNTGAAATRRQIFMKNLLTNELRQITFAGDGDSTKPSVNKLAGMVTFESTAALAGFPNPTGVSQVYVYQTNPGRLRRVSLGPPPANVLGLGASRNPILNETGTGVAFESTSDLMGSGVDTGVSQIFYVDLEKREFIPTIYQVTDGNGPSQRPHLGFTKVPNPGVGQENRRKVLLFESSATNLPGSLGIAGNQIYEVAISGLLEDNGAPSTVVQHLTTSTQYGNCSYPSVDPSGNRIAFICDGDPLLNGTTGNRVFARSRGTEMLFQLTGAGDVQGPIGQNIGQWFTTLSTTSDLTQGGSCGYQLYILDFTAGKWAAATSLGQVPPDALGQGLNSVIGLRNFELAPGTGAAGSQLTITTRTGTTTANITTEGRIGMFIGAPDEFFHEADVNAPLTRIKLPAVAVPGYGAVCLEATGPATGDLDCDGGLIDGDIVSSQDHLTDDIDFFCENGCREDDASCQPLGIDSPFMAQCPVCDEGSSTCSAGPNEGITCTSDTTCQLGLPCTQCPVCDEVTQVCTGGPQVGFPCSSDATCRVGLSCNVVPACNGPLVTEQNGVYAAGGLRVTMPIKVGMSLSPGLDDKWCTDDDVKSAVQDVETILRLTTGASTSTIVDADAKAAISVVAPETGAAFDCARLRSGDLAGSRLVGTIPLLNLRTNFGMRDAVIRLRLEPKTDTASSCNPFCLAAADCDDGNACNGAEACNANHCEPGTPLTCDDSNACNGVESCEPTIGCQVGVAPTCNDANPCNGTETCNPATGCAAGVPVVCADADLCDGVNACNPANGLCESSPAPDCEDNNVCTDDSCAQATGCVNAPNVGSCDDGSLCTTGDTCAGGSCVGTPTPAAVTCNAGNGTVCDGAEACNPATGNCEAGTPLSCNDNNPCTDDTCDAVTGCAHTPNTASCTDGSACTSGDTCSAGSCIGIPVVCNDSNACNGVETCDPGSGCLAGTPPVCDDSNTCTADSCVPATGCMNAPVAGSCSDGSACTSGDTCSAGSCVGTPIACDDGNACNGTEACDPGTGCLVGTPPDCDDANSCTTDSCVAPGGCVNANNTNACDDGSACTTTDTCSGGNCNGTPVTCTDSNACNGEETCNPLDGSCLSGAAPDCDDNNDCTDDSCNPGSGCVNANNTNACDDGTACTTGDACSGGSCGGAPLICSDNNACNGVETCDPASGCLGGSAPNCVDDDECTADVCDPIMGCQNTPDPNYALCRMNVLADALVATPAESLGGVKKKQKLVRMVTGSIKLLQKGLAANPRQAARNLRGSQRKLQKFKRLLQKFVDEGIVTKTIGDEILDHTRRAALALEALGN